MLKFSALNPEIHQVLHHVHTRRADTRVTALRKCFEGRVHQDINTICTVDVDVLELRVAFGTRKGFWCLAAHELAKALGADHKQFIALPMFYAYTGYNNHIVSSFCCWDKKTAWDTLMNFDNITTAFCALVATPDVSAIDDWMEPLE